MTASAAVAWVLRPAPSDRQVPAEAFRGPAREVLSFASQLAAAGDDRLEVTWPALRAVGAGFWLTDREDAR